ncbi:hypothetical protein [Bradyrhizobium sp. LTSP885]|uniref:hypothetical protein n=1 Tax=Bradyrhizobium sp. LTSP885 TaxID=1619232 RepID=UPI0005CAF255|nr:hypothetical protein [Bradyrhizobium sp. LTSP885]
MDQQQKSNDTPIETIAKTVPGEFVSFVVLLKAFLASSPNSLVVLGILLTALLPVYAKRILGIASWPQIALMMVSYLAWFFLLIPDEVDHVLMNVFASTLSFKNNITTFAAVALVFQFALPFFTKPKSATGGGTPAPEAPSPAPPGQ